MGKPQKMKSDKKVLKNKSYQKIEPTYQKDHKSMLKSHYLDLTPLPYLRVSGGKKPKTAFLATSGPFLGVSSILQAKMNATIVFSVKIRVTVPSFIPMHRKSTFFVGLCFIWFVNFPIKSDFYS